MKKLLLITQSSNLVGGSEEDFTNFIKYLQGKYELTIIYPPGPRENIYQKYSVDNLKIKYNIFPTFYFTLKGLIGYFIRFIRNIIRIYNFLRDRNYHICYLNSSVLFLETLILNYLKIPVAVYIGEDIKPNWIKKIVYKIISENAKVIFLASDILYKSSMKLTYGNIKIIKNYPTADIEFYYQMKNSNEVVDKPNEFRLINIGGIDYNKNQEILIKAISLIEDKYNIKIILVGNISNKKYYNKLIKKRNALISSNRIVFKGELSKYDTIKEILKSSCVVITSRCEGFSIVFLESLFFERPVIAPKVGVIPEIIIDKKNGLIYENDNSRSLANAIEELFLKKDLYNNIKQKCFKTYSEFFDNPIILGERFSEIEKISKTNKG